MNRVLDFLRPHPHRGDVIAAGSVPLALAAIVIELRMTQWPLGARFVVVALLAGLPLSMGWLAQLEHETPRAYHSVLLLAGLLPLIVALQLFAEVLGSHRPPGAGADAWTFAIVAGIAAVAARRANSSACTLVAALSGAVAVEALVSWVFHPSGLGTFRALLLVLSLGFTGGAVALRDRHRRHAVQLVNAAGITTLVLGLTFLLQTTLLAAGDALGAGSLSGGSGGAAFGWKLYVLAIGFGLIAYGSVDEERGPAYLGVLVLGTFALLVGLPVGGPGSLVGWPLFLLALGAVGLAIGLRPRKPLPPQPGANTLAPTVPLREADDEP